MANSASHLPIMNPKLNHRNPSAQLSNPKNHISRNSWKWGKMFSIKNSQIASHSARSFKYKGVDFLGKYRYHLPWNLSTFPAWVLLLTRVSALTYSRLICMHTPKPTQEHSRVSPSFTQAEVTEKHKP